MTEEGKSPKPNAGISLLPWKTQTTRFPHSHCPTPAANLSQKQQQNKKQHQQPNQKGAFLRHPSRILQAHLSIRKDCMGLKLMVIDFVLNSE
jgi:hypothetical protein